MSQARSSNSPGSEADGIVQDGTRREVKSDSSRSDEKGKHVDEVIVEIMDDQPIQHSGTDRNKNDTEARKEEKQKARVPEIVAASSSDNTRPSDSDNNSKTDGKQDSDGNKSGDQTDLDSRGFHREIDEYNSTARRLFGYLLQKNWEAIEDFIVAEPLTVRLQLFRQEVFLFLLTRNLDAPYWLTAKLMKKLSLARFNDESGRSPLFWPAMYGNKRVAKAFVKKYYQLVNKRDRDGYLPVHVAASCGHKDVTMYLLAEMGIRRPEVRAKMLEDKRTFEMLEDLVKSGLYGIALALLKNYPDLACHGEVVGRILTSLAETPQAFKSGSGLTYWERFIYHWIPVREEVLSFIPDDIQRFHPDRKDDGSDLKDDGLTIVRGPGRAARVGSKLLRRLSHTGRGIPGREEVISFTPPDIQREDSDHKDDGSDLKDGGLTLLRRVSHAARGGLALLRRVSHAARGGLASLRRPSHATRGGNLTLLRRLSHTGRGLCHKLYLELRSILMLPVQIARRSIKPIHDAKLTHMQTLEIVRNLCPNGLAWRTERGEQLLSKPFLTAARFGIYELVEEILVADFSSFTFTEKETEHDILRISIIYRQEEVFSLLNKMNLCLWHWKAAKPRAESNMKEGKSENLLHLAGELVRSTKVSGAALQMQRELQWFKAVESYVHPSLRGQRNKDHQTPRELFTKNHESLVKEGEKWMKETATSCTIVAALIITAAFAAAFTVPGGTDARGFPNFLHKPSFIVFTISFALALFSSTASVLTFLGILTSRYSEEDFLESLPKKLIFGHITLFLSIASMMVAFGAAVYILLSDLWPPVFIPIAILGGLTVIMFARIQFPLLIEVYLSTYRSSIYQGMK